MGDNVTSAETMVVAIQILLVEMVAGEVVVKVATQMQKRHLILAVAEVVEVDTVLVLVVVVVV